MTEMKNSTARRLLARYGIVALAACFCVLHACAAAAATYYVDSTGGNDNWNGTSPSTAWQSLTKVSATTFSPGDQILLKADSVWNGQHLYPKGSGSAGNPIVMDVYGTGAKPLINGEGAYQEAVYLYNQEHWEISNLDVTNYGAAGPAMRQGVRIIGEDCGTLNHIHLLDLEVHDVNGHMTEGGDKGKNNGGILMEIIGTATGSKFNDVLIEGCYVHDVSRTAIKMCSEWSSWCENPTVIHGTNVVVRNNYVDHYAGDGICPFMTDNALVEYNVSSRGCYELESGLANAPLWSWDMTDGVYQYNEVYDTVQTRDGMGFDIDGCCVGTIVQYNYFHDNGGGMLMIIGTPDCVNKNYAAVRDPFCNDNIVRYNISQRDATRILEFVGKIWNNYVYNNTIYVGPDAAYTVETGQCGDIGPRKQEPLDTYLYNNIIYNTENSGARYSFRYGDNYVWDYNLFYGLHPSGEPADSHKITSDPLLVNPGSGGIGRGTVDGYKLQATSPARDSGMTVPDNGGQDYWGNAVPSGSGPDRGAHEYVSGPPPPPVADFSGNPTSGDAPLDVDFTDLSTNNPTSWDWTFGDGGTSAAHNPSHTYAAGTYTVSLTAGNAGGSDTETKTNYITAAEAPPTADFVGVPISGVAPLDVDFTDLSTNSPTSWDWTFGDSGTSGAQNPSHTYAVGTYTVSLTAANAHGQDTETKIDYITASSTPPNPPVAGFVGAPTSGAAPLAVDFTDLSTNSPTSWDWTFGDGGTSAAQNPSHTYAAGTYTVSLTAGNAGGSDTETKTNYITATGGGGGDYTCTSLTIAVGALVSGDHTDTHVSDDVRMVVDSVKSTGKHSVDNIYTFETGLSSLSNLTVTNESQYSNLGSTGYQYRYIDVWNYSTGDWDQIDNPRIYTAGADVTTNTNVPSASNYISAGQVQVRFRHGHVNGSGWTLSVDHVKITAQP
jgi:PKD repeat protein